MIRNHVGVVVDDGVATVTLARPDKRNGLTLETLRELCAVAHRLGRDRTLRVVILDGAGPSFCAGLDFGSVLRSPVGIVRAFLPRPVRGTNAFQEACWAWRKLPAPVIAVVHGHCYGGGLQLALSADARITTADARWSVLETKWGLIPDMSGIRTLSDLVRPDVACLLTMTGEELSGERAVQIGLATECVATRADAAARAAELVDVLRQRSPDQLAATKALFLDVNRSPRATFRHERRRQLGLLLRANTARARAAAFGRGAADFVRRGTLGR